MVAYFKIYHLCGGMWDCGCSSRLQRCNNATCTWKGLDSLHKDLCGDARVQETSSKYLAFLMLRKSWTKGWSHAFFGITRNLVTECTRSSTAGLSYTNVGIIRVNNPFLQLRSEGGLLTVFILAIVGTITASRYCVDRTWLELLLQCFSLLWARCLRLMHQTSCMFSWMMWDGGKDIRIKSYQYDKLW